MMQFKKEHLEVKSYFNLVMMLGFFSVTSCSKDNGGVSETQATNSGKSGFLNVNKDKENTSKKDSTADIVAKPDFEIKEPASAAAGFLGLGNVSPNDVKDFLIQDVCVNSAGKVEDKDPAICPMASRRNVNLDETSPYSKTDMGPGFESSASAGWQRSDSFPLQYQGKIYVVKTFDFGGPREPGKKWGKFEDHKDGFDIAEIQGNLVSYIATKDGGNDNYWAGKDCKLDDGWVLFPLLSNTGCA
jgi:hypothetical protein